MIVVVIVIHLILVLGMIAVILLQKSEGGGLVSSTSGFMTGRGTANVLTRTTAILAFFFFITSLGLSWYAGLGRHPASIISPGAPATQQQPAGGAPLAPLSQGRRRPEPTGRRQSPRAGRSAGAERAASAAVKIGQRAMARTALPHADDKASGGRSRST